MTLPAEVDLSESLSDEYLALAVTMLVVCTLFTILRFWSNYVCPTHRFGLDDAFAIVTWILVVPHTAVMLWWISIGYGRHVQLLQSPEILNKNWLASFIILALFPVLVCAPRFSALFFYRRIFGHVLGWFRIAWWSLVVCNAAWVTSCLFVAFFQCRPIHAAWTFTALGTAKCVDPINYILAVGSVGTAIDVAILVLPVPKLWGLQTTTSKKWLLIGMFLCGYSVVFVSLGRMITAIVLDRSSFADFTYATVPLYYWAQSEGPVSLISISVFNVYSLVRRMQKLGLRGALPDELTESGLKYDTSQFTGSSKIRQSNMYEEVESNQGDQVILVSRDITVESHSRNPTDSHEMQPYNGTTFGGGNKDW